MSLTPRSARLLLAGTLTTGALLAGATPALADNSGITFTLKHHSCQTSARYFNASFGTTGDSQRRAKTPACWHWVKLWIHDYPNKRNFTTKAEGTKQTLQTAIFPRGQWLEKRGTLVYKAEFGLCGKSGSCITKTVTGAKKNW